MISSDDQPQKQQRKNDGKNDNYSKIGHDKWTEMNLVLMSK